MTTWDVRDATGGLVTTLPALARVLGCDHNAAVKALAEVPDDAGLPPALMEAKAAARKKPGDGTPPPISTGNFVSWSGGKGRVDLLVRSGKVPGVDGDVEGSAKSPAARVVVWRDGKATREKIAKSTHTLRRIPPLDKDEKASPAAVLVSLVAEQDESLPEWRRVDGPAVKAAFDRGASTWPGPERTSLTQEQWATGRAEYLVKAAMGAVATPGHDTDLLHHKHPMFTGQAPAHPDSPQGRDQVHLSLAEVQETVRGILADAT